jgi:hypothetical protein
MLQIYTKLHTCGCNGPLSLSKKQLNTEIERQRHCCFTLTEDAYIFFEYLLLRKILAVHQVALVSLHLYRMALSKCHEVQRRGDL